MRRFELNLRKSLPIALSILFLTAFLSSASQTTFSQTKKRKRLVKATVKKPLIESFDKCLPAEIQLSDVVSWDLNNKNNRTVKAELVRLKAKCFNRKLLDVQNKEIRFFKTACYGNPPAGEVETEQGVGEDLDSLKKKYTVVVFNCNPMIQ